ncbi:MAG: type II secretion system protein [Bacilli bacterium]
METIKDEKGFTVIELVIVMGIMIITMGILAYGLLGFNESTKKNKLSELNTNTKQAVLLYYNLFAEYPSTTSIHAGMTESTILTKEQKDEILIILDKYTNSELLDQYTGKGYEMKVKYPNKLILDISFE